MASCWTYRHADGQQRERRRHVDLVEPSMLITDPRGVGDRESRVASSTCSENGAKGVSKQPEAGSHDNRLSGAYISAQIACGYVLHSPKAS